MKTGKWQTAPTIENSGIPHRNDVGTNSKWQTGFTLVELLLYMALFGIFMVIITRLFSSSIDVQLESQSSSSVEQDGRYILTRLSYDISQAQAITAPSSLGSSAVSMQLTINAVPNTYTLSNGSLQVASESATNQLNSSETVVSNFSVERLGNSLTGKNTLRIGFTLTSRTQRTGGAEVKTFTLTDGLR